MAPPIGTTCGLHFRFSAMFWYGGQFFGVCFPWNAPIAVVASPQMVQTNVQHSRAMGEPADR